MSATPLDILCKVAADAELAHPPPPPSPLPPIRPQDTPLVPLPPINPASFRLSSSAPTAPGFLSGPSPLERTPSYNRYYVGEHNPAPRLTSLSVSYPHPILNPPHHAPQLPRNMSAPSLGDTGLAPHPVIMDESYRINRIGRTPSPNIPVPARVPATQPISPPLYGSPSSMGLPRVRSPAYGAAQMKGVSGRASKTTGRRDSYTRFTAEEEAMLMEGVRVYGVGNWKKILNSYRFHWKRTAVDLKDKYRNMTRAKMRRLNASSQSDLSSVGSDEGRCVGVLSMSPLQSEILSKTIRLGISPVSTGTNTPAGSVEERDKLMRR